MDVAFWPILEITVCDRWLGGCGVPRLASRGCVVIDAKITNAAAPSAQTAALGQGLTLFVPPGEWDRLDVEQVTGAGFRLGP